MNYRGWIIVLVAYVVINQLFVGLMFNYGMNEHNQMMYRLNNMPNVAKGVIK